MLFNSLTFAWFFPLVTVLYFLLPHRWRWLHLLTASCIFYMYFIPAYILILAITITIDYWAGIWIDRSEGRQRKLYLVFSIISTCLVLFVFKYYNFFITNYNELGHFLGWNYSIKSLSIILPIGLSFHTFQSLSYVIEVYRGKQKVERDFGIYSLYVMYYPQLVAGPIERPQNLIHQFKRNNPFRFRNFHAGIRLMLIGFFMKLVVADRLGVYVDAVYNNAPQHNGSSLALATVFFSFQIYCDFAGYSSIAIGASRIMGIRLMTNFRRPYFSRSVSEFWRRWHISLSTWFKDYVFIPLGGSMVFSVGRLYFNLLITFLISGFWHGANWTFILWGALNGFYLIVETTISRFFHGIQRVLRSVSWLGIPYVFIVISFSWIFFRSKSATEAYDIIGKILFNHGRIFTPANPETLMSCLFSLLILILGEGLYERVYKNRQVKFNRELITYVQIVGLIFMIGLLGVFDGGQFIYFQF